MKKLLFLIPVLFLAFSVTAQTSKELIGKWQLVKWTKNGKDKDIVKANKTDQVFQVFKESGNFESVIGDKTHKGSWKLNTENTRLTITVTIAVVDFKIDYFDATKRIITSPSVGTLEYKKVSE